MKRLKTIFGIQGLLYLIAGVLLVVFGFQSPEIVDDFNIYWMMTASSFVLGVLLFIGKNGENVAVFLSRIVVGGLFIVSGLIKANDTIGFGFKLEEYFRPQSLGAGWAEFHDWSLPLSILISGAEVLLGLAILLGAWTRVSSSLILAMTLFFAWLTNFTAECVSNRQDYTSITNKITAGDNAFLAGDTLTGQINYERMLYKGDRMNSPFRDSIIAAVDARRGIDQTSPDTNAILAAQKIEIPGFYWECVEDCGCFGDALKGSIGRSLTPRESFYKDMFLLFFVLVVFFKQGKIKLNSGKEDMILVPGTLLLITFFGAGLFGWWFPTIFTAVAVGIYLLIKKITKPGGLQVLYLALAMAVLSYGFAFYTYTYLPIKDYRPYKVGDNVIKNRMLPTELNATLPPEQQLPLTKTYTNWLYRNRATWKDTIVVDTSYISERLWEDSVFNDRYMAIDYDGDKHYYQLGYDQKIKDFSLSQQYSMLDEQTRSIPWVAEEIEMNYDPGYAEDTYVMLNVEKNDTVLVLKTEFKDSLYPMEDGTWKYIKDSLNVITPPNDPSIDFTDYVLGQPRTLWVISYDLTKANKEKLKEMKAVMSEAQQQGVHVAFISSASPETVAQVQSATGFYFPYYICDATELKIVVRSNPGMIYLESGEVKGKWDYNRIPEYKDLK